MMKNKETLEEVAERITNNPTLYWENNLAKESFIEEAKWQKEQTINSIEQVIKDICKDNTHLIDTPEIQEIIKYFKK